MSIIHAPNSPTHVLGGTRFTSLATPTNGSTETSVWRVEIDPGTPPTPHSVTREEVFVVLSGVATVRLGGERGDAAAGDAIAVAPHVDVEISTTGTEPLRLLCCLPVGGQAQTSAGTFTPPWAE